LAAGRIENRNGLGSSLAVPVEKIESKRMRVSIGEITSSTKVCRVLVPGRGDSPRIARSLERALVGGGRRPGPFTVLVRDGVSGEARRDAIGRPPGNSRWFRRLPSNCPASSCRTQGSRRLAPGDKVILAVPVALFAAVAVTVTVWEAVIELGAV